MSIMALEIEGKRDHARAGVALSLSLLTAVLARALPTGYPTIHIGQPTPRTHEVENLPLPIAQPLHTTVPLCVQYLGTYPNLQYPCCTASCAFHQSSDRACTVCSAAGEPTAHSGCSAAVINVRAPPRKGMATHRAQPAASSLMPSEPARRARHVTDGSSACPSRPPTQVPRLVAQAKLQWPASACCMRHSCGGCE